MIPIPKFIISELQGHINSQCSKAEAGYESANQDEDTITGDFLGSFRTQWNISNGFEWRFSYNKIRGRGKGAPEKVFGTDGIITVTYDDGRVKYYKSLVFQAKKGREIDLNQQRKMNDYFPNGNIFFMYGPNGYYAEGNNYNKVRICKLLADEFLTCKIGIEGLHYNSTSNKFIFPAIENGLVKTKGVLEIEVKNKFTR